MKILLFFIILITSFSASSAENDFDKVCGFFEKLDSALTHKKMTPTQKHDFISELVSKELEANSPARQAWEVIGYAVPDERYEMYQSTAKEILKSNWQCAMMKKHISSTGN